MSARKGRTGCASSPAIGKAIHRGLPLGFEAWSKLRYAVFSVLPRGP